MESKKIFDLISSHRWNDIISIIKNNKYIDLNIRDNSSYYLINYAIVVKLYIIVFNTILYYSIIIQNKKYTIF